MKKSTKKLWALGLSAAMAFSVTGCGNNGDNNNTTTTPAQTTANNNETTTAANQDETTTQEEEKYDFGGQTVRVWGNGFDQLLKEDEDLKYAEAKAKIEEKYNIVLEPITLDGYDGTNETQLLLSSVASGEPAADIVVLNVGSFLGCVMNNLLLDITEYKDEYKVGSAYLDAMTWNGKCYGISYDDVGSCWVMVYDRDYLKQIGMEKTPTEMFMEGKWDYENFKSYLADMKSKLPEGVYPIGAYPFHWATMAGAANGYPTLDSNGHLAYKDEPFIEAIQLYRDLQTTGLAAPAKPVVKDDGSTGYQFAYRYDDESIVLARAEQWEFGYISYDFGIVPYPWGSNVTCDGDYKTLSDNYKVAFTYWGGISVLDAAVERTGIPGNILTKIAQDYQELINDKSWMHDAYEKEQNGEKDVIFSASPGAAGSFTTQEDIEINDWMHSRFEYDWGWGADSAELMSAWDCFRDIYGPGNDIRATLESYYNEAAAKMKDAGLSLN